MILTIHLLSLFLAAQQHGVFYLYCLKLFDLREKKKCNIILHLENIYNFNYIKFPVISKKPHLKCRLIKNFEKYSLEITRF